MARSIWTGAISFGLVTVPVKLYSAVNRKTVRFHQLSGKSGVRIAQKRVDPSTGDEVAYDDIVKGFELTPDRYVVIEPGELETLQPKKTKTIEIEDFVELSEIDPIFYDHPYYLAPGAGGAKPYRLLVDAMRETGRVAIARVVIRSKEALVALRPMDDHVLGMSTMLFPDEIVDPDSIDEIAATADVEVDQARARHRQAARRVARRRRSTPSKYHDTYRQDVLDLIERKAAGEEIAVQPAADEEEEPVPDLMAALKASLDAVRDKDADGNGGAKPRRRRRSRRPSLDARARARARRPQPRASAGAGSGYALLAWPPPRPSPAPRACAAPTAPGRASRRRRHGRGFRFLDRDGEPVEDKEVLRAHPRARDPAGVGGRVDLPLPGRPHPGDRRRRRRAQAVPLPPALARAPRHGEVRGHGRLRAHAARAAQARGAPSSADGDELTYDRVCACAVRLLDRGFFRVGGEDYAVRNESYGLATMKKSHVSMRDGVLVFDYPAKSGKRRVQAVDRPRRGRGRRATSSAAAAAATSCWPTSATRRWVDVRSEDINA